MLAIALIAGSVPSAAAQQAITPDSLFVALFSNGDALIEYDVLISDPEAEAVTVPLFGTNINDLIVTDLEDRILEFEAVENSGEVTITPAGAIGARISYTTPDLVGKERNQWTLAIDSPTGFSVKMPPDSVIIDWGDAQPGIIQVGDQTLLTFDSGGSKQVKYIIGSLGTEEQANITIKLVQTTIRETKTTYPGIVLAETESLLSRAVAAKDEGKFAEAERLAAQANDVARTTIREYIDADEEIEKSQDEIDLAAGANRDVTQARSLLGQASALFVSGKYVEARSLAVQAASAIGDTVQFPFAYVGVGAAAAAAGAFVAFRKRLIPAQSMVYKPEKTAVPEPALEEPEAEIEDDSGGAPVVDEPAQKSIPESRTDTGLLGKIVSRIFEEKPHLRQEDRDVLQFLAEKEGAAFESEVRTRFQLPKTTVWRLVKRLEREELVEIRKAGGQNLIKLRFEGRQP